MKNSNYKTRTSDVIINWGHSGDKWRDWRLSHIINHPVNVATASNKLKFLRQMDCIVSIPDFTTDPQEAYDWQHVHGDTVVARTTLTGHAGEGIVICAPQDDLPEAPLYTKLINTKDEFRVHVVGGEAVEVRHKKRRKSIEEADANYHVRSYDNGWAFNKKMPYEISSSIAKEAVLAVKACGLDFGAVDVVWDGKYPYVLEVNTAPGLTGSTTELYANALYAMAKEIINGA